MRVGIIGFGLIGQDRYKSLVSLQEAGRPLKITGVYDPFYPVNKTPTDLTFFSSLKAFYGEKPDWVIVAVPHDEAVRLTKEALKEGCKVLVEKPLGRTLAEAKSITKLAKKDQLFVGFNYRFFTGIAQLITDARAGRFGDLVSVNILMGHGGAPDNAKGWKLDPIRAGGGCLIDPGIHLLDLCRLLTKDEPRVTGGGSWQGFWRTGIEEESHLILQANQCVINFQVSIVRWRSTFRFEVNGTEGYGVVTGRNRSYGPQQYIVGPRWGWQQAASQQESEKVVLESTGDDVFSRELDSVLFAAPAILPPCNATEALKDMELLEQARKALKLSTHVK